METALARNSPSENVQFVSSSKFKFEHLRFVFENSNSHQELSHLALDPPEIQSLNPEEIVRAKLEEAARHSQGTLLVEDTCLSLARLNGLPGPYVRSFFEAMGPEGIYKLSLFHGSKAEACTTVGLRRPNGKITIASAGLAGDIVAPKGEGHGWTPIFRPNGAVQTLAEMDDESRIFVSPRTAALKSLLKNISK